VLTFFRGTLNEQGHLILSEDELDSVVWLCGTPSAGGCDVGLSRQTE